MGRIVNTSTEGQKLDLKTIGLLNFNENSSTKIMKINMNVEEVPEFSVFEGEVVIAIGNNDLN